MKRKLTIAAISIVIVIGLLYAASKVYENRMSNQGEYVEANTPTSISGPHIAVLFDNYKYREGIDTDWGFSCIIKGMEKTVLFDTGANGTLLIKNMEKMNMKPEEIDAVVLSHNHADHTSGLSKIIESNKNVEVYLLNSFPEEFKRELADKGVNVIEVRSTATICSRISTTGLINGEPDEQSLIIDTDEGSILITGCSHPGASNIVERAKELTHKDVSLLMGGFHMSSFKDSQSEEVAVKLQELGVKYIAPSHCTGSAAIEKFKEKYNGNFIRIGAGKIIPINGVR